MRILVIPNGFEANYTLGFLRGLIANRISPTVVVIDGSGDAVRALGAEVVDWSAGLQPEAASTQRVPALLRYYVRLAGLAWRHRRMPVLYSGIFTTSRGVIEGPLLCLLLRLLGGPFYYVVHNLLPHNRGESRFFRCFYRFLYRLPQKLVVHTPKTGEDLVSAFGIKRERIVTISIGLNEEVRDPECTAADARVRLGLAPDSRWLLFFGKVDPYKGLDLLLEAWRAAPPPHHRLAIVGACPDPAYRARIFAQIASLPDPTRVHWDEGYVPNDRLALWLTACDAGVLPYRHIYQSGVVFLYLRFGLPVLACDVGSLRDYLPPPHHVLVEPRSPPALARGLATLLANLKNADRQAIRDGARRYAWPETIRPLVDDLRNRDTTSV